MKIRFGFVSNSSSMSYIVQFVSLSSTVRIAGEDISVEDFFEAIRKSNDESEINGIYIEEEEKKELIKSINKAIPWSNNESQLIELRNDIENCKDKQFASFDIGYHYHALIFLLNLLVKYNLIKIRYVCEG